MTDATAPGNGPYETSDQVRHLPSVRAVYDVMHDAPGRGAGQGECEKLLTSACAEAGVTLGAYDARIIRWLANWEPETCMVVAGLIARAAQRPEGTVTQWGVSFGDAASIPRGPVQRYRDEDDARQAKREVEALDPSHRGTVVSRQTWAGRWTPAPGEEESNG